MISSIIVSGVLLGATGALRVKWRKINTCYQALQPMVAVFLSLLTSLSAQFPHLADGTKPLYPPQKAVVGAKH